MKKLSLLISMLALTGIVYAQIGTPSYLDVVRKYCTFYEPEESADNQTVFARKKDGWYVMQVNRINHEELLSEKLFYSFTDSQFHKLDAVKDHVFDTEIEKHVRHFLYVGGGTGDWYNFDH